MARSGRNAYVGGNRNAWSIALSLSFYEISIPAYRRGLLNLASFLDKAKAHAAAQGANLATYAEARLAPDMHPFTRQVQLACDAAKGGAARLAGVEAPGMPDTETTLPELKDRIARTIAFLDTIKKDQVDDREGATIELPLPGRTMSFTAPDFLMQFSLANFLFHVTTAYALLRAQGVPLGKMDFLAGGQMPAAAA
ncbi:MAG TPA: DUF1993 domain-containing protein [Caulobacteraceae bacterium]|nr:DUF1993 domain-containing protein [Caulobacteraceae bacterium]